MHDVLSEDIDQYIRQLDTRQRERKGGLLLIRALAALRGTPIVVNSKSMQRRLEAQGADVTLVPRRDDDDPFHLSPSDEGSPDGVAHENDPSVG